MSGIELPTSTHLPATSDDSDRSRISSSPLPSELRRSRTGLVLRRGGTTTEYCLAAALIGVVVIPGVAQIGAAAVSTFGSTATAIETTAAASPSADSSKQGGDAGKKKGGKAKGGKGKAKKSKGGKAKGKKAKGGKGKGGKAKGGKGKGKKK